MEGLNDDLFENPKDIECDNNDGKTFKISNLNDEDEVENRSRESSDDSSPSENLIDKIT